MIPKIVWDEQAAFNSLLRTPPHEAGEEVLADFLRDMALNMLSECDEMLSTTHWKLHRRDRRHLPNRDHRLEECIDKFKLWLTEAQGLGFTAEELTDAFWRKSMVVRQRHSEEWVKKINSPSVVFDIDNVICDYTVGFCQWLQSRVPSTSAALVQDVIDHRAWFSSGASFGLDEDHWRHLKHAFRTGGGYRGLPPMKGAIEFLSRVHAAGFQIILITARAIDQYPNVFSDTVYWLQHYGCPYDWVWWSRDKGNRISTDVKQWVRFAVDDDPKYTSQFVDAGFPTYWLQTTEFGVGSITEIPGATRIRSLDEIHLADYI